ncbi:MAG: hypothetical protein KDB80_04380 [Planctomycetes bacterium]|nr:hypothetical protein [Planctomycetota bacterium]
MKARFSSALCVATLACSATSQMLFAPFGLTGPGADGHRQVGTIRYDGAIALRGNSDSIDAGIVSTSSGMTAYDAGRDRLYMIGRAGVDGSTRLFVIDLATGGATSQVLVDVPHDLVTGIVFDDADQRLSILFDAAGDEQLATIDPTDGSIVQVGTPVATATLVTSAGVVGLDAANDRMFFLGKPSGGADRIYAMDTVTGVPTSQPLSGATVSSIVGMSFDELSGLLFALIQVGYDRQLATLDPASGVVMPIGVAPIGGGTTAIATIQGVTSYDPSAGRFYFVGRAGGQWSLYSASTSSGVATSSAIDETAIKGGLYVGLEFPVECGQAGISYPTICSPGHHALGGPLLSITGTPQIGTTLTIRADNLMGNAFCGLMLGVPVAPTPLSVIGSTVAGSKVCLNPWYTLPCSGSATATANLTLPPDPLFCGGPFAVQWAEYTGVGMDFGTSRSAELVFGN